MILREKVDYPDLPIEQQELFNELAYRFSEEVKEKLGLPAFAINIRFSVGRIGTYCWIKDENKNTNPS